MTYNDVCLVLGITRVCLTGQCGLSAYRHKNGTLFIGVLHWTERRITRRGLRRFLLLVARREREENPEYWNDPKLRWFHVYSDEMRANDWAAQLGYRFPIHFSRRERHACLWAAHKAGVPLSVTHSSIYSWAVRGLS